MLNQSRGKAQQTLVLQVPQEKLNLGRGCVCMLSHFSHVRLFAILWTVARQAPLSMGFSREEYWSGLPCPSPGDLPDPGFEPASLMSPALAGRFFITNVSWEALEEDGSLAIQLGSLERRGPPQPRPSEQPANYPLCACYYCIEVIFF